VRTVEERFWSKVAIGTPDECWEWQRSRRGGGYGQFRVAPGRSPQRASRVAWTLANGPIPDGMIVCHRCDNPPCCNPAHLWLGTVADNNTDKIAKGRGCGPGRDSFVSLVSGVRKLTDEEILLARRLYQQGRSCRSIAREFGVAHTTISRLVNGQQWKDYLADDKAA
jgi:hypothetical protein